MRNRTTRSPGLQPRALATADASQPIASEPASGAAQVFAPYTLIEHVLYELIQAGLLRDIVIPSAANGGVGNGFKVHLVPTQNPRLQRDPNNPEQLAPFRGSYGRHESCVHDIYTTVRQPRAGGPAPKVQADVTTVGATAAMTVFLRPRSATSSGVYVEVAAVRSITSPARYRSRWYRRTSRRSVRSCRTRSPPRFERAPQIGLLPRSINVHRRCRSRTPHRRSVRSTPCFQSA